MAYDPNNPGYGAPQLEGPPEDPRQGLFNNLLAQYAQAGQASPQEQAVQQHLATLKAGLSAPIRQPSWQDLLAQGLQQFAPVIGAGLGGGGRYGGDIAVKGVADAQTRIAQQRKDAQDRIDKNQLAAVGAEEENLANLKADRQGKLAATKGAVDESRAETEEERKVRLEQSTEQDRLAHRAIEREKVQAVAGALGGKVSQQDKFIQHLHDTMRDKLNVNNMRGGADGVEAKKANLAEHVLALALDKDGNPAALANFQEEELAMGVANMTTGGNQAAASIVHNIKQHTGIEKLAGIAQWALNHPQDAQAQEFTKLFAETAKRQGATSKAIIQRDRVELLPSFQMLKKYDPDGYARQLSAHKLQEGVDFDPDTFQYRGPDPSKAGFEANPGKGAPKQGGATKPSVDAAHFKDPSKMTEAEMAAAEAALGIK